MATREQRKASKRQAKREGKRRAFRKGVQAARAAAHHPAPDIRRNTHLDKGRAVSLGDIRPYARQKCARCKGRGLDHVVKNDEGEIIGAEPCKCAHERFMRAHPEVIVEASGAAFWPDDPARPLTAGTPPQLAKAPDAEPLAPLGPHDGTPTTQKLIGGDHTTPVDGCRCVNCRAGV